MRRISNARLLLSLCIALAFTVTAGTLPAAWAAGKVTVDKSKTIEMKTTYEGTPTSYTGRGVDAFSVGYYVQDGKIVAANSLLADKDAAASNFKLDIVAEGEGFNAIIANGKGTDITVTGTVKATDEGDGKNASDFSALGTMFLAHDYAKVTVKDMNIFTDGFVRAAFIADDHGSVMVKNTTVTAMGANPLTEAFDGFVNSANQAIMISPPWVLGIQGGIRGGNMLGDNTTMTVIDSSISVSGWAVLSTDACSNPMMNIVDTDMIVFPESKGGMSSGSFPYSSKYGSGYGTYFIGNAVQNFYGANIKGMTYAGIYTGGEGYYKSSNGKITLKDADGNVIETVTGKGKPTTIETVWGFMSHGGATVNVTDGTVVNTEESTFLYKAGDVKFNLDNAKVNPRSGIILQMIDNDDSTVGMGDMTNMAFNTEFKEKAGWPSENGSVTEPGASGGAMMGGPGGGAPGGDMAQGGMPGGAGGPGGAPGGDMAGGPGGPGGGMAPQGGMPGGDMAGGPGGPGGGAGGPGMEGGPMGGGSNGAALSLANGDYKGDLLNGTGYYTQSGASLDVTIGKGATLTGAISLTETRHVDENGKQNTHFTINEYYYLGHVENRNYRNETASINVVLKDGGTWTVTGESLISKLTVENGTIAGAKGKNVVMTVDGKSTKITAGKTYEGDIVISLK